MDAPTKIRDLDLSVDSHEDILGLDVAVNDVLAMQVAQSGGHLGNVLSSLPFGESRLPTQVLIQLTLGSKLKDEEDALAVMEVTVKLENIGVAKIALDLDLSPHLLLDTTTSLDLALVQHFKTADVSVRALTRKVDTAELALAERLSDLEHAEVEGLRLGLLNKLY